jgi:hypothetical protein
VGGSSEGLAGAAVEVKHAADCASLAAGKRTDIDLINVTSA